MIYILLLDLTSAFTNLGVNFGRGVFSSHSPDVTSIIIICYGSFFVIRFNNTFIDCFCNLHVLKKFNTFFSNIFTIKTLQILLITPSIWNTVQKDLIKIHITKVIIFHCSWEGIQILIKINQMSSV